MHGCWHMSAAYAEEDAVSQVDTKRRAGGEADEPRRVSLFRNGRNQALRIPREMELPGETATIRKEGDRLVVEPVAEVPERSTRSLVEWLKTLEPLTDEEALPDIEDHPPEPVTVFDDWPDDDGRP